MKSKSPPSVRNNPNTTKNNDNSSKSNLFSTNEPIDIMALLGSQNYVPLSLSVLQSSFDKYDNPKISTKSMTEIKSYAANTNQGVVRYV